MRNAFLPVSNRGRNRQRKHHIVCTYGFLTTRFVTNCCAFEALAVRPSRVAIRFMNVRCAHIKPTTVTRVSSAATMENIVSIAIMITCRAITRGLPWCSERCCVFIYLATTLCVAICTSGSACTYGIISAS